MLATCAQTSLSTVFVLVATPSMTRYANGNFFAPSIPPPPSAALGMPSSSSPSKLGDLSLAHLTPPPRVFLLQLQAVRAKDFRLADKVAGPLETLSTRLASIGRTAPQMDLKELAKTLGEDYERVVAVLRADRTLSDLGHQLSTLRPTNYHRNLVHFSNAMLASTCHEFFFSWSTSVFVMLLILIRCVWSSSYHSVTDILILDFGCTDPLSTSPAPC